MNREKQIAHYAFLAGMDHAKNAVGDLSAEDCFQLLDNIIASVPRMAAVAEVVSKYGDPEAFGEREIRVLADLSTIPYGTKLVPADVSTKRMYISIGFDPAKPGSDRTVEVYLQGGRRK